MPQPAHETKPANGSRRTEVVAHFPGPQRAAQASQAVRAQAPEAQVETVPEAQARRAAEQAEAGVSVVEIGALAWAGLLLGATAGAVLGVLIYRGALTVAGIAPALSAGPVATAFLGAGVLGAAGWLLGALWHLALPQAAEPVPTVRASVRVEDLAEAEQQLVEAGALAVLVLSGHQRAGGGESPAEGNAARHEGDGHGSEGGGHTDHD